MVDSMKKLVFLFVLCSGPCFAQTATRSATLDRLKVNGTGTFNNSLSGLTTNTQWNGANTVNPTVNSVNFNTEYQFGQGSVGASELFSFGVSVPSSATVHQVNVVGCYQNTFSAASNAVCGYFQNRLMATGAHGWGINPVFIDNGFAGTGTSSEHDCNITNTGTTGACIQINGAFPGTLPSFPGLQIAAPLGGGKWSAGIAINDGATQTGINLGSQTTTANSASQTLNWTIRDAGNVARIATINATGLTANRLFTLTDISGNLVTDTATQTLSNKTLTSPVVNGTPTGTGIATLTLKKGSGAGNYTTASTTYVVADSTNLCLTVTIPTGWKLGISASGSIGTATAAVLANVALTDNAACSTANAGVLVESVETTTAAGVLQPWGLNWVITGDGNAHNIALQYKTSNGADSATLLNSSATSLPTMVFTLMPSN